MAVKFINPVRYNKHVNYIQRINHTKDTTKVYTDIVTELMVRAPVLNDRAPVAIIFYTIRDINPDLLTDIRLIDMFAVTKDILLNPKGVNAETVAKYNISDASHKILKLAAELNKLIKYPSRQYLIDYHVNNKIDEYGPQWYNFTSTIQNNCIQYCIDRINEAFTENAVNLQADSESK